MNREAKLALVVDKMRTNVNKIHIDKFSKGYGPALLFNTAHAMLCNIPEDVDLPQMTLSESGELGMVWFFDERQFDLILYPDGDVTWTYASGSMPNTAGFQSATDRSFILPVVATLARLNAHFVSP